MPVHSCTCMDVWIYVMVNIWMSGTLVWFLLKIGENFEKGLSLCTQTSPHLHWCFLTVWHAFYTPKLINSTPGLQNLSKCLDEGCILGSIFIFKWLVSLLVEILFLFVQHRATRKEKSLCAGAGLGSICVSPSHMATLWPWHFSYKLLTNNFEVVKALYFSTEEQ